MLTPVTANKTIELENYVIDFITLPVYEVENRLHNIIPKIDKTSNWISTIGIFISIILGVISYLCVDAEHRPSAILMTILSIFILIAFGFAIYLLCKSYKAITVHDIIDELKK